MNSSPRVVDGNVMEQKDNAQLEACTPSQNPARSARVRRKEPQKTTGNEAIQAKEREHVGAAAVNSTATAVSTSEEREAKKRKLQVEASRRRTKILDQAGAYASAMDAQIVLQERDPLQALLIDQSYALHSQGMALINSGLHGPCQTAKHQEVFLKRGADLMRLSRECVVAYKKLRTGGRQLVTVQHVQVNGGGQAVVAGNVNKGKSDG
jgi:hypothetical protein